MRSPFRRALVVIAALIVVACARTTPEDAATSGDDSAASSALTGTEWRLVELEGDSVLGGVSGIPTIRFTAADSMRVGGNTGCNSMGGTYETSGTTLRFGPLITTKRACADSSANAQEVRFVGALQRVDGYRIEGDRLVLLAGSQPVARFERGT
jgi:heat shock protein HslJ